MKVFAIAGAMLFCAMGVSAQGLKDASVAMKRGDWKVLRSSDAMTDQTSCTGIYKDNFGIQLSPENLFIRIDGGIESVTLRFDDNPPTRFRLATSMEKKLRSIDISGSEFAQLRSSRRLRYQSSTLVSGIQTGEIDLTDFQTVLENIQQGCPASGISKSAQAPATNSGCSVELIGRMKKQGLSPEQIAAICQ
jgi:hypothetical protein